MIALTVWSNGSFSDVFVSLVPSSLVYFILHLRIPRYCNEGLAHSVPTNKFTTSPPPPFFLFFSFAETFSIANTFSNVHS